jgi:hypothetical protein
LAITYFTTRDDAFVYLFQHVKDIFRLRKLSMVILIIAFPTATKLICLHAPAKTVKSTSVPEASVAYLLLLPALK